MKQFLKMLFSSENSLLKEEIVSLKHAIESYKIMLEDYKKIILTLEERYTSTIEILEEKLLEKKS